MKRQKILKHRWPLWQDKADSSIYIRLQEGNLFGDEYNFEEISTRSLDDDQYEICSIPLSVHGVNLGDTIIADHDRIYIKTTKDAGRYGFRLAVNTHNANGKDDVEEFEQVVKALKDNDCAVEFFSHIILAVSVDNKRTQQNYQVSYKRW